MLLPSVTGLWGGRVNGGRSPGTGQTLPQRAADSSIHADNQMERRRPHAPKFNKTLKNSGTEGLTPNVLLPNDADK